MLIKHYCVDRNALCHGLKGWKLLLQRFQNVETVRVVNVIRQLARSEFKDGEGFKNVCIHAQKLQSRLLLAGEAESEPPFNVMFLNGLPERIDFFAIQECFIPVGSFAEL